MGGRPPGPLPTSGSTTELDRVRSIVSSYFPVYETRIGPQSVLLAVHVDPATLESKFDALRQELWTLQYVPILRRQSGEEFIEVVRRPKVGPQRLWVNLLLLLGTIATTTFAGSLIWLAYVGGATLGWNDVAFGALYFSAPVMTILGLHELAHFVVARRHHVEASLPYFLPVPPPFLFGTFGAFISIREPFPDKKALFDIGAAGPLAGFAASIPIVLLGAYLNLHTATVPLSYCGPTVLGVSYGNLIIGTPLFLFILSKFIPFATASITPLELAGWVGILVTAINLLPASQLDGGHVFRALLGDRTRYLSYAIVILLLGIGLLFYSGWIIFAILLLFLGVRHPPPLNDSTPLDVKRYLVGACVAAVLVTGFVLTPLATPPGAINLNAESAVGITPPPGAQIAANLSVTVVNQDPVAHAFWFASSVTNFTLRNGNNSTQVTGGPLFAAFVANSTWVYHVPGGKSYTFTGNNVSLPSSAFVTINATGSGSDSALIVITYSNSELAAGAGFAFGANEFCAPSTGGTDSTSWVAGWT
jgi:membrane-associated protease RseP (regulator of RpoE activity)